MAVASTDVELTTLSPSRIKTAQKCGLAFKYQYVDRIPAPSESAAMMFGNVVHDGVEQWYGPDEAPADHTTVDLAGLFKAQWPQKLPPGVWRSLQPVLEADKDCEALAQAILATRDVKAPRLTKAFQTSPEWKSFNEAHKAMMDSIERQRTVTWPKNEDPLKAWAKSLEIAEQLTTRWGGRPRPIAVERPFRLEFEGYSMRGRLDQLRADPTPDGEVRLELTDIKTGKNLMTQMDAFLQAWLYDKAIRQMDDLPNPEYVVFDMVRHNKRQRGQVRPEHDALARRILNDTARNIIMANFEPAYGFWCDRCDFKDLCEKEISLWEPGTGGVILSATG